MSSYHIQCLIHHVRCPFYCVQWDMIFIIAATFTDSVSNCLAQVNTVSNVLTYGTIVLNEDHYTLQFNHLIHFSCVCSLQSSVVKSP